MMATLVETRTLVVARVRVVLVVGDSSRPGVFAVSDADYLKTISGFSAIRSGGTNGDRGGGAWSVPASRR